MYELHLRRGSLHPEDAAIHAVPRKAVGSHRMSSPEMSHNGHTLTLERQETGRQAIVAPPTESVVQNLESAALAVLEKLNRGVLMLDADGTVQFMNRAAHAMFSRRTEITIRRQRLVFTHEALQTALLRFLAAGPDTDENGSLVLRVDGAHQTGIYRVLVTALARDDPSRAGAGYCVFIYEPNGGGRPIPPPVLRKLYGLTAAETRLANALFVGQSLRAAAKELCVSLNTAKSTLKSVFQKCSVGSQAELVLLLSLGPRTL